MRGNVFDAITRVLLCGMAVIVLTVLAIPELIELGFDDEEDIKRLWAPGLSAMIVAWFYAFFYIRPRFREFGKPGEDYGKWAICTAISITLMIVIDMSLDMKDTELDWLPAALTMAIASMGQFAALEWHLLELGEGRPGED